MKRYVYILIISLFGIFSCEGPVGPQGPAGYDGLDGLDGEDGQEGFTFDFENVTFSSSNDYSVLLDFPEGFQMYSSEVVLVYFLWGYDGDTDIWRALPQTIISEDGILQYNYDFTMYDVNLFLESDFSMSLLQPVHTDDWIVRVVVVPALYANARLDIDYTDYYDVAAHYGLSTEPVKAKAKKIERPAL